jgi:hypothetical protein
MIISNGKDVEKIRQQQLDSLGKLFLEIASWIEHGILQYSHIYR